MCSQRTNDPYHLIGRGTKGTVDYVDDIGILHCTLDNGRCQGVVTDKDVFHVIDRLNVSIAERYAYLLGFAIDGNKRLHSVQEVAEFICKHGQYGDVRITTMEGKELLDTFGIYINKISDMEYREELLKVLISMQHEVENAASMILGERYTGTVKEMTVCMCCTKINVYVVTFFLKKILKL